MDINTTIQNILSFKNRGGNPQQLLQMLMAQNPEVHNMINRVQNMAQGRNPQEFLAQLAKQNGVSEQNLQAILSLFNKK